MASSTRTIQGRGHADAAGAWLALLLLGAALLLALPHPDAPGPTAVRAADAAMPSPTPTLYLQVGPRGDYALDGRPASTLAVEQALRDARGQSPDLRLRIDAEGNDPRRLIDALALAEHAGIRNVGSMVN